LRCDERLGFTGVIQIVPHSWHNESCIKINSSEKGLAAASIYKNSESDRKKGEKQH